MAIQTLQHQVDDQLVLGLFAQLGPAIAALGKRQRSDASRDGAPISSSSGNRSSSSSVTRVDADYSSEQEQRCSSMAEVATGSGSCSVVAAFSSGLSGNSSSTSGSPTSTSRPGEGMLPNTLVSLFTAAAKLRASLPRTFHEQLLLAVSDVLEVGASESMRSLHSRSGQKMGAAKKR